MPKPPPTPPVPPLTPARPPLGARGHFAKGRPGPIIEIHPRSFAAHMRNRLLAEERLT